MNTYQAGLGEWTFKAVDDAAWLPAQVPGCVHTDLLRNGLIPDPFYGTNERDLQWIDKKDWEYESRFDVSDELLGCSRVELVFEGLDTYAEVTLNGHQVLSADNMFRTWRVDVKRQLRSSGNRLHIRFRSPIREDLPKLEKLGYQLPASNDQSENGGLGDKKVSIFARKAPYHYGWDWGPRFVTSGIWKQAYLTGWTGVRINDLFIRQDHVTSASAAVTAVVEVETEASWSGELRLTADGRSWSREAAAAAGASTIELSLEIAEPRLWWSRGLGKQELYSFAAELIDNGQPVAARTARTGLRSVKLVRNKEAQGTTFYFELNGKPLFAKGANHIPNDSFVTEVTRERYRHEIETAAESNMNMLRVWGGGVYEYDDFYELCDEYGILVWQDFMFACSMYPGDEPFLNSVEAEAKDNIRRLRNHPSIALWCGNNEIDAAWQHFNPEGGWGWKQQFEPEIRERIWRDYEAVFHRILPDALLELAPGAAYWPSSPIQALTGDIHQHATSKSSSGDIHYWGVWHAVEPFENYNVNIGRFMSEYGFQSFPAYKSVRRYAEEKDLALESDVMLCHQRNNRGNQLIKEYMEMYLQEPKDFPSFLYLSQILQAEAMKMAIEAHRRNMPYTMGTLYWQMNDCWPVASWAGMDYYGRWKALQYFAKNSFRDFAVSIDGTKPDRVDVHLLSDLADSAAGTLRLTAADYRGGIVKQWTVPVQADPGSAAIVYSASPAELLGGRDARDTVLVAELLAETGEAIDSKFHYFVPGKDIPLAPAAIRIREEGGRYFAESDVLARGVWLDAEAEGIFSDNYFDLLPGFPAEVTFRVANAGEGKSFGPGSPGVVTARSMADFVKR